MSVIIETSIGDITVDLYTDERPRCSMNFLKLCKIKYYNFSLFHTVQQNLVAQTGDPTATGRGGDSIYARMYGEQARFFEMEMTPRIKHTKKGLISMVNNGSGMHGSQFFLTLADNLDYLDGKHTVFGEVAEGFDILEKLNNAYCGEDNRPFQDIRIYHTIILDDPYDDPAGLEIPDKSPGPTEEMLNSDHIPCDADIDEDKDKTEEEMAEIMAEKEAKANTQILEMVGDLPEADVAPPENVLFVCKLNPVTTAEDLEIIFSRFGIIVNCDVIKDSKTGESLQYAFVEFEKPENCESAYFKMDNVLIDDRRIHVDFSQSVSKLKWKGKGRGVEILDTGDAPKYVLKNQQRQNGGYDLVYDHGDDDVKKDKGRGSKREDRKDGKQHRDNERKRIRSRSRSPDYRNENRRGGYNDRWQDQRRSDDSSARRMRDERSRREDSSRQKRDRDEDSRGRDYERSRDRRKDREQSEERKRNRSRERGRRSVERERSRRSESFEDDRRPRDKQSSNKNSSKTKDKQKKQKYQEEFSDSDGSRDSQKAAHKKKKKKKHKESKNASSDESEDERVRDKGSSHKRKHRDTGYDEDSDSKKAAKKSKKKHKSKRAGSSDSGDDRRR